MNYITEAKRLGVAIPGNIPPSPFGTSAKREDGLCISGCDYCRQFRNNVRAALEAEKAQRELSQAIYGEGYNAGYDDALQDLIADMQERLNA